MIRAVIMNSVLLQASRSTCRQFWTHSPPVGCAHLHRHITSHQQQPVGKPAQYDLVYKFPYIVAVRVVSRFKILQTAFTSVAAPFAYIMAQNGQISHELGASCIVASMMALGTLYYISFITRRLIGLVGIDKSRENVKLARMTFWGNRKDLVIPLEAIVPLTESRTSSSDIYTDVKTYDDKVDLYISLRYGGIQDVELFEKIFGRIK